MKLFFVKKIKFFLCLIMILSLLLPTYSYNENFYYLTPNEFLAYIQNDLTYFGETFSLSDYNTLIDIYGLFQDDLHYAQYHPFDLRPIKEKLSTSENFLDYVLLTGDSYSGNLNNCFVKYYNYKNGLYENAGHTVLENISLYKNALYSSYPIIVISTSVNDVLRQTNLSVFKRTIEELFESARLNNKIIVIHSNCNFFVNGMSVNGTDIFPNRPKAYDEIIKLTAVKYQNVVYVDCKDIATREYLSSDDIHYNEKFHYQLAKKIYEAIRDLVFD